MSNRYRIAKTLRTRENRRYYSNLVYPDIPVTEEDTYIITTDQDRYDLLAQSFYGDSTLWWIIPIANGITARDSLYPTPGTQLRIPANKDRVVSIFENENNIR